MAEFSSFKGTFPGKESCYLLQFDGLSVPNPGEATSGAVLFCAGRIVFETGEYVKHGTNNTAEYGGLLIGLRGAINAGIKNIHIEGDSQLVIKQVLGEWAVNNLALKALHAEVLQLLGEFTYVGLRHVRREHNAHADGITNEVIKTKTAFFRKPDDGPVIQHVSTVPSESNDSSTEMMIILKDIQQKMGLILERLQ